VNGAADTPPADDIPCEAGGGPPPLRAVKALRYRLEARGLRLLTWLVPKLPRPVMLKLADVLGAVLFVALRHDRRVAMANLDIAFGDTRTPADKKRIARAGMRNLCRAVVGLFWAPRLTPQLADQLVEIEPDGERMIRDILAAGRGVIFCTPHYGDWELSALAVGFKGIKMLVVGESTPNAAVADTIFRLRTLSGHRAIPPQYAVLKLLRGLRRGESTAILVDVNGRRGRGGVWCEFFGLPVFNSTTVAELALRTNAAIVIGICRPLPGPGGRVRLEYGAEIPAVDTGDRAADHQRITNAITKAVEDLVRSDPEHWLWTYKRWKRRPTPDQGRFPWYSKYAEV